MTNQNLIPENEVTDKLNRAKQAVNTAQTKYFKAVEAKKEAERLVNFLNGENHSFRGQITDLERDWVELKTEYDGVNSIAQDVVKANLGLQGQNAKLEEEQAKLVDLVQKRTGELTSSEVQKLGLQTMASVALDANAQLEGTVGDLQADVYDIATRADKYQDAQLQACRNVEVLETKNTAIAQENAALQDQVIDGLLIEGKQAARLSTQRDTIRNLYSREAQHEEELQGAKRDTRRLEITVDELSDENRVQTARANKFKSKSKRAGRIVAEQITEVSEANLAYVCAKQEAQDAKTNLAGAQEEIVDLELDNLVLEQKNIALQDQVSVLDAGANVAVEANVELQSQAYALDCKLGRHRVQNKKAAKLVAGLKTKISDLETDVLTVELEKTAIEQKYDADEADIAKLEVGYARLEADNADLGEIVGVLSQSNAELFDSATELEADVATLEVGYRNLEVQKDDIKAKYQAKTKTAGKIVAFAKKTIEAQEDQISELEADVYDANQVHQEDLADVAKLEQGYAALETRTDAVIAEAKKHKTNFAGERKKRVRAQQTIAMLESEVDARDDALSRERLRYSHDDGIVYERQPVEVRAIANAYKPFLTSIHDSADAIAYARATIFANNGKLSESELIDLINAVGKKDTVLSKVPFFGRFAPKEDIFFVKNSVDAIVDGYDRASCRPQDLVATAKTFVGPRTSACAIDYANLVLQTV